jgi:hypothetical protein
MTSLVLRDLGAAHHFGRRADRRQGIPQFVRQHGEELVFPGVGFPEFLDCLAHLLLRPLSAVDFNIHAVELPGLRVELPVPFRAGKEPAIVAVLHAQPELHLERCAMTGGVQPRDDVAPVILVKVLEPLVEGERGIGAGMSQQPKEVFANADLAPVGIPFPGSGIRGAQYAACLLALLHAAFKQLVVGEVQRDLGKAEQRSRTVFQCGQADARPEQRSVFLAPPGLFLVVAILCGFLQVVLRPPAFPVLDRVQQRKVLPDRVLGRVALHHLCRTVPGGDHTGGVHEEHRHVTDFLGHEPIELAKLRLWNG